ncbi:MAG: ribbon-helix-helix protein, CopG family [Actinobacteria bacterium]|nr:MAG: ribbon-helix-helix protein, CopG family [Actinomycetota bacterium]
MERTQIYLTDREKKAVKSIARRLGKTQSEVIRTAVDRFIDRESTGNRLDALRRGRGLWKGRKDLPNFELVRQELDRTGGATSRS